MIVMVMIDDDDDDDFSYSSTEIFPLWKVPQGWWTLSKLGYQRK